MKEIQESRVNLDGVDGEVGMGARWFFGTSLVFLMLGALMLAGRPDFLMRPVLTGHGLAWLVLVLLGAGMGAVFGVVYWAVPRVFGVGLYSEKFVILHYGFHYLGVVLVMGSVVWEGFGRGEMGMTFLACGAVVMGMNLVGTFRRPALPDVASGYLMASALWMLVAALMGVPFTGRAPVGLLEGTQWSAGWLVLAMTGVVLNLPMGVALRVTPAVLGVRGRDRSVAWYGFAFTNAGLAWLFPAVTFGPVGFVMVCVGVYAVGVVLFFARYFMDVQLRGEREMGWDSRMVYASVWLLPVVVGVFGWGVWGRVGAGVVGAVGAAAGGAAAGEPEVVGVAGVMGDVEVGGEGVQGALPVEYLPVDGAVFLLALLAVAIPMAIGLAFSVLRLEGRAMGEEFGGGMQAKLTEQVLLAAYFNYATGVLLVVPGAWFAIEQMLSLGSLFLVAGAVGFIGCYALATGAFRRWMTGKKIDAQLIKTLDSAQHAT